MDDRYIDQVRLLLSVLPDVAEEKTLALKGGTAINLFYRDLPRLSVDVDLTYVPIRDRKTSLGDIDVTFDRIAHMIQKRNPNLIARRELGIGNHKTRISVSQNHTKIKIEISPVMRGTVLAPITMSTSDTVVERFGFAEANVLAFEDLFGSKLHAAVDRQHPRDLFDVMLLFENEGFSDDLFRVFLVYVAGSSRPLHDVLAPNAIFEDSLYETQFAGMTAEVVTKDQLVATQERLKDTIASRLTGRVSTFLLSLHDGDPNFELIDLPDAIRLPAIQWKLQNLGKLKKENSTKHAEQRATLEKLLR